MNELKNFFSEEKIRFSIFFFSNSSNQCIWNANSYFQEILIRKSSDFRESTVYLFHRISRLFQLSKLSWVRSNVWIFVVPVSSSIHWLWCMMHFWVIHRNCIFQTCDRMLHNPLLLRAFICNNASHNEVAEIAQIEENLIFELSDGWFVYDQETNSSNSIHSEIVTHIYENLFWKRTILFN